MCKKTGIEDGEWGIGTGVSRGGECVSVGEGKVQGCFPVKAVEEKAQLDGQMAMNDLSFPGVF